MSTGEANSTIRLVGLTLEVRWPLKWADAAQLSYCMAFRKVVAHAVVSVLACLLAACPHGEVISGGQEYSDVNGPTKSGKVSRELFKHVSYQNWASIRTGYSIANAAFPFAHSLVLQI